ncbi:alpha-endosulfine isoform X2 [Bacillus rossius redtenbacheri]|uniref:alpha-endosulfine isoform X2 n=1 Tax=Bacillus rossius redtenbacheri TaxID=93214 RepID=UPI002FDEE332
MSEEQVPCGEEASSDNEQNTSEKLSYKELEKLEEEKLKAKMPKGVANRPMTGHSVFLQKRLAHKKYFDSGDYQMAKQKTRSAPVELVYGTGDTIPTPETVPVRKTSIIQPTKFSPSST